MGSRSLGDIAYEPETAVEMEDEPAMAYGLSEPLVA